MCRARREEEVMTEQPKPEMCISHWLKIIDYEQAYVLLGCEKCPGVWTYYRSRADMDRMGVEDKGPR